MSSLASAYRTAFVTGASSGIGKAMAEMLLDSGVRVWGTARDPARLESLKGKSGFVPVKLDLAEAAEAEKAFVLATVEAGGAFDLVVNNAGYGTCAPFTDADFSLWQKQIEAMVTTTMRLAHLAIREMLARKRGCLVNVSSLAAEFPLPFMSGYNVAKAALSALSESLIFETRGTGVTVIDFRPGDYRTDFNRAMQTPAHLDLTKPRLAQAWRGLERHLNAAPAPEKAAQDLRRALLRARSGTVRSGSFLQAQVGPFFARFVSAGVRRAIIAGYYRIN